MNFKDFKPTEEMLAAAEATFAAMAYVETIRPIVIGIQKKVIEENNYRFSEEMRRLHESRGEKLPDFVKDHKIKFMMNSEDFDDYHAKCKELEAKQGLTTEKPEYCPLLVAESVERRAKNILLDALEPVTGLKSEDFCGLETHKKAVDLTLRLMSAFMDKDKLIGKYA